MLKDMLFSNAMLGNGGGGGGASALVVTEEEVGGVWQLDKTWQEINDAAPLVWLSSGEFLPLQIVQEDSGDYSVKFFSSQSSEYFLYVASSADGYPSFVETGICGLKIKIANLEIDGNTGTLSLTWQEMFDADFVLVKSYAYPEIDVVTMYVSEVLYDEEYGNYLVNVFTGGVPTTYSTDSPDGYPTFTFSG